MTSTFRVALWNIAWRLQEEPAGREMRRRIDEHAPDLICITEGHGHLITSTADYGYPLKAGRRKVLLWSRTPWENVDQVGHPSLPPGRYVAGRTVTPFGQITVIGICIPWEHAHVSTGRKDRRPWEDHCAFLDGLGHVLSSVESGPVILLGDFNQTIPRRRAPIRVHTLLGAAIPKDMTIATTGPLPGADVLGVDHLAHTLDLRVDSVLALSNRRKDRASRLSDHFGLVVELQKTSERG